MELKEFLHNCVANLNELKQDADDSAPALEFPFIVLFNNETAVVKVTLRPHDNANDYYAALREACILNPYTATTSIFFAYLTNDDSVACLAIRPSKALGVFLDSDFNPTSEISLDGIDTKTIDTIVTSFKTYVASDYGDTIISTLVKRGHKVEVLSDIEINYTKELLYRTKKNLMNM